MTEHPVSVVHQAAHAVSAVCFGVPVPPVDALTTRFTCDDLLMPQHPAAEPDALGQSNLMAHAVMFLSGPMADSRTRKETLDAAEDKHPDVARAREITSWASADNPGALSGIVRGELTINAMDFLDIWESSISAVVAAALQRGSVSPDQVQALVAPAIDHSRRLAAYHEGGHAVALWLEGDQQVPTAIGLGRLPAESSQNFPVVRPYSREFYQAPVATNAHDRELAVRELEQVVAGEEMARLVDPSYPGAVRARNDRREAQRLSGKLVDPARHESAAVIEARARAVVVQRFQAPEARALVDALASALLAQSPLGEEDIRGVLLGAEGQVEAD